MFTSRTTLLASRCVSQQACFSERSGWVCYVWRGSSSEWCDRPRTCVFSITLRSEDDHRVTIFHGVEHRHRDRCTRADILHRLCVCCPEVAVCMLSCADCSRVRHSTNHYVQYYGSLGKFLFKSPGLRDRAATGESQAREDLDRCLST